MKNTKQIQKEVRELIKPQMIEGHYDPILINRCVEATLKAIDYAHSYTTYKPILEDRIATIKSEPDGVVRETMIDNLLVGLYDL